MAGPSERKQILVAIRTYPTPAKKGVEVSCTAGITRHGEWIRLFPMPSSRRMETDKRFRKYQWIDLSVTKASDPRPESFTPDITSIRVVGEVSSKNKWAARKRLLYPLRAHCLCCLQRQHRDRGGSHTLGLFRPSVIQRLVIEPDDPEWSPDQLARLRQFSLFETTPARELEKIPYRFKYEFRCDDDQCSGHSITSTDWEMSESYRSWKRQYGDVWEAKFRQRYEREMIELNDTHFYVGTLHGHPATWIIVGLFYPRR